MRPIRDPYYEYVWAVRLVGIPNRMTTRQMMDWAKSNLAESFEFHSFTDGEEWLFKTKEDAALFALTWAYQDYG